MTNTERFQEIEKIHIECEDTVDVSVVMEIAARLIALLTGICKEQEEQIKQIEEKLWNTQEEQADKLYELEVKIRKL